MCPLLHCRGSPGLWIFAEPSRVLLLLQYDLDPELKQSLPHFLHTLPSLHQAEETLLKILGGEGGGNAMQSTSNVLYKIFGFSSACGVTLMLCWRFSLPPCGSQPSADPCPSLCAHPMHFLPPAPPAYPGVSKWPVRLVPLSYFSQTHPNS